MRRVLVVLSLAMAGCSSGASSTRTTTSSGSSSGPSAGASSTSGTSGSHTASSTSGTSGSAASSTGGTTGRAASSSTGGSSGSTGGSSGSTGGAVTLFPPDAPWNEKVVGDPKAASSDAIIADLAQNGGWGNGNTFQIDFSITVLHATPSTEFVSWSTTGDWYDPDCDHLPMPAPLGGALEGETGYACDGDGDCHLLVLDDAHQKLYEMWRANQISPSDWEGGCQAVWDLAQTPPANLRGDGCTSADAAGLPMTALLFNADEVAAGHIDHAIRFILPNARIRHGVYVRPATHSTNPTAGGPDAPPYGVRFRLRADYPVDTLPSEGAKVVARALQTYGMILSDGGQIALTAESDRFTTAKWSGLLDAHDLAALTVSDFQVVDLGTPITLDDCVRNP